MRFIFVVTTARYTQPRGSSPRFLLHMLVVNIISSQLSIDHPHLRKNPSDISQPPMSHGGDHTITPRCSISEWGNPSNRPPMVSDHSWSSSNVPIARMTLSRQTGCGMMSIHSSCGIVRCKAVGCRDAGRVCGLGRRLGRTCSCAEEHSVMTDVEKNWERIERFVMHARRTLYWRRMIR